MTILTRQNIFLDLELRRAFNLAIYFMNISAIFLIALALYGCAATPNKLMYIGTTADSVLLQNKAVAKDMLLSQFDEWKGTKYKYGGLSKDGIDCSGFIYETYLTKFGIKLPRQSIIQGKVGVDASVELLQPGDLVFFKTGITARHIGIYIDKGEFLHVSETSGVTKSNLSDPYWQRRFWKARRITM